MCACAIYKNDGEVFKEFMYFHLYDIINQTVQGGQIHTKYIHLLPSQLAPFNLLDQSQMIYHLFLFCEIR